MKGDIAGEGNISVSFFGIDVHAQPKISVGGMAGAAALGINFRLVHDFETGYSTLGVGGEIAALFGVEGDASFSIKISDSDD